MIHLLFSVCKGYQWLTGGAVMKIQHNNTKDADSEYQQKQFLRRTETIKINLQYV